MNAKVAVASGEVANLFVYDDQSEVGELSPRLLSLLIEVSRYLNGGRDQLSHFLVPAGAQIRLDQQSYILVGERVFGHPVYPCERLTEAYREAGGNFLGGKSTVLAAVTISGRVILGGY